VGLHGVVVVAAVVSVESTLRALVADRKRMARYCGFGGVVASDARGTAPMRRVWVGLAPSSAPLFLLVAGLPAQVAEAEQHVPVLPSRAAVLQRGRRAREKEPAGGVRGGGGRALAGVLRLKDFFD